MKQFIVIIYSVIIVLCGLTFNYQPQKFNQNQSNSANLLASENLIYSSDFYDLSKFAANKDINQSLIPPLHISYKYFFSNITIEKYVELTINIKIIHIIHIANSQVIRLEGYDIIHPFNYFW